jgi:hypothetical protein
VQGPNWCQINSWLCQDLFDQPVSAGLPGGFSFGDGGVGGPLEDEVQCNKFDNFFSDNYIPALAVASQYGTSVMNLLGLSAFESGWGTSPMYNLQNNPFGATPGGDRSAGVQYNSISSAWQSFGNQWGRRMSGTGNNSQLFVNRLLQDNQGRVGGLDTRGPYNTQNTATGGTPGWSQRVLNTIDSVENRITEWNFSC